MPYVTCSTCSLSVFSADTYPTRDFCPSCGNPLPAPDSERRLRMLTEAARDLRRQRAAGSAGDVRLERRFDELARHAARAAVAQRDAARRDPKR